MSEVHAEPSNPADRPPPRPPLGALAAGLLLLAPAVDELCSAAPTVGAPGMRVELALSVTGLVVFGTVIPVIASMVFEPALLWASDGPWRRQVMLAAGGAWSAGYLIGAVAPNGWALALGLSLVFVAGGVALGAARASLVAAGDEVERALTRWELAASVGDLAGPLGLAGLAWLGGGWRAGMFACGVAVAGWVLLSASIPVGPPEPDDDDGPTPTLRSALADRTLLAWLLGVASCTLLDELFVAGIALYGVEELGLGLSGAGLLVAADMTGATLGVACMARMTDPSRALIPGCVLSLAGLTTALAASDPWLVGVGLFACGFGTAPHYPLALAAAHRARPGHPGQVEALQQIFIVLDLLFPLAFGLLADRFGLAVGLAALGLQPVGLIVLALTFARRADPARPAA